MPLIMLTTFIHAPIEQVFDLARNIDLHQQSMQHTAEKAIGGRTSGMIEVGETVTWEAKHLFKVRTLTSRISAMNRPYHFRDEMIKGDFKALTHDHYFRSVEGGTEMQDAFYFSAPYNIIGRIAEKVFLKKYLAKLLHQRNLVIKEAAEGGAG